jgi:hypothetical protein
MSYATFTLTCDPGIKAGGKYNKAGQTVSLRTGQYQNSQPIMKLLM